MALIKCHECGNAVSTSANSCPKCGAPIAVQTKGSKQGVGVVSLVSAAIVFGVLAYLLSQKSQYQREPQVEPSSEAASSRDVGSDAVLRVESGDVVLCVDESAYSEFLKLALAKDYLGMGKMEGTGRLFRVPSGTKARVIDSGFEKRQVRIMDGSSFGRSGWLTSTVVQ